MAPPAVPDKYKSKTIYRRAKAKADAVYDKPSAYKSGYLIKEYKDMGGRLKRKNKSDLEQWFRDDWVNLTPYAERITTSKTKYACGEKAPKQKGPSVCRSSADAKKYNRRQIKKAVAQKKEGKRIQWSKL